MAKKTLQKPKAFQDVFTRKSRDQKTTHYCPGCGHGIAHKLIAEAMSDLGLQDRSTIVAPVGCSIFLYYYFDCRSLSVPHGRGPAAMTGISRVRPDTISISYQGDGDLAAIGTSEIIHSANRGENIAVFFINNAIYGMTGGQMAPTTPLEMRTTTSPRGRASETEGFPIAVCELISTLRAPVYVERVSLDTPANILGARRAIRKALQAQADRKGFTLVEILSPCPTQWRVDPTKTGEWIRENMHPIFKPGVYRDVLAETPSRPRPERREMSDGEMYALLGIDENATIRALPTGCEDFHLAYRFAGFGGQGVILLGMLLAQAGMASGYQVTWLPSYGPEMRGGTANSSVVLSTRAIGSPMVAETDVLVAMNGPSLEKFLPTVAPGGCVLYDSDPIETPPAAPDGVHLYPVPARDIAQQAGEARAANVVMLGVYAAIGDLFEEEVLADALRKAFAAKKGAVEANRRALAAGADYARSHFPCPAPDRPGVMVK
ncbi:2-oxoacid:acceptor oxidoreductase family protein [Candidatus Sumerlaeota bacterium]|nr:2-oxoacid:acceptor oxidoreductase family protein [Candidatus Sumerlaeota bacterium]